MIQGSEKIIIIIILGILSFKTFAQAPHPAGSYTQNADLDKFVGTWLWTSGSESVKIILQKQVIHYSDPLNYDEDRLVGWHLYIKNGVMQQSSMPNVGLQFSWDHPERVSLFGNTRTPDEVYFTKFWDYGKNKKCDLYFAMVSGSTTQATWKLVNPRGMKVGNFDFGFSLPTDLILTKQ